MKKAANLDRPNLSRSEPARAWIKQFRAEDQMSAARLVDALILLNDEDVAAAIRSELKNLAILRREKRRKVALYAEREYAESAIFNSKFMPGRDGKIRMRAFGDKGPLAVNPVRGKARVGSEGWIAFLISQAKESSPTAFLNHPGPDRIRRHKVGLIAIVTDFIGSGERVLTTLDKFMRVPTVRSWVANRWVGFVVVAAAGSKKGVERVSNHRTVPSVRVTHIVPSLDNYYDQVVAEEWRDLMRRYGPREARGAGPLGFDDGGTLVALSYRTPNNTPLLLHAEGKGWKPLFEGPIDQEMRPAFGLPPLHVRVRLATLTTAKMLDPDLSGPEARMILVLRSIRGHWRQGQEIALSEMANLTVPEVLEAVERARNLNLLNEAGRLTDNGQQLVHAGTKKSRRRPDIPTRPELYYPLQLRAPR